MSASVTRPPETRTRTKPYHRVPTETVNAIAKSVPLYGSMGRALQVATELLIRQKKPIRIKYKTRKNGKLTKVSYKLLPRTIALIDKLTPLYGGSGQVLAACVHVLKEDAG